jgi:DNA-directed RNA polymerase subunit RPC12/RpoP
VTIRNYLFLRTTGVSILAVAAGILALLALSKFIPIEGTWFAAATVTWLVAWFTMLIPYSRRIRCPRCNKALGIAALTANMKQRSDRVNVCPHCGVGFDEPMEKPVGE